MMRHITTLFLILALGFSLSLPVVFATDSPSPKPAALLQFNPQDYPGINFKFVENNKGSFGVVDFVKFLVRIIKQLLAPVLIFVVSQLGFRLLSTQGADEEFNKVSKKFMYVLAGIGFVIVAQFFADMFTLYSETQTETFLSSPTAILRAGTLFQQQTELVLRLLRYVLGGIAVFYTVKGGLRLMFFADEETATKSKEMFSYGFVGFLIVMISDAIIRIFFRLEPVGTLEFGTMFNEQKLDVTGGLTLIGNITNFFLAIVASISLFTLVVGGAMYVFTAGNEERGKKATNIIISSVIGLVISFSAYTLVAEFTSAGKDIKDFQPKGTLENYAEPPPAPTPITPP